MTSLVHSFDQDATGIAEAVCPGKITARSVAERYLSRVSRNERDVQAFAAFDDDLVREQADRIDNNRVKGTLAGVPICIKDIFDTKDWPTRFNSPIYASNQPSRDAQTVAFLRQAGAIIIDRKSTRLNSSHRNTSRMPSSA